MSQALPERSNLEFLKKLAKERLRAMHARERHEGALRARGEGAVHARGAAARLSDAQLAIAREYGFPSWRALHAEMERRESARRSDRTAYVDPFVTALPERRKAHKVVQWKPIMDAAFEGDASRAAKLLDAGADPNIVSTTPARMRPLHRAVEHKKTSDKHAGHDAVVKLLLERGADPHLRATGLQLTALQLAAIDEPRFVKAIRRHFDALDIHHAAALGDDRRVERLLAADRSLAKALDVNGFSPLHYCAASAMFRVGDAEASALVRVSRLLTEAGVDPNGTHLAQDGSPIPPLYYAAGYQDNPAMVEALMDAGADPCDNESIFHASDEDHRECLAVFERRVDPKKLAKECTSALPTQVSWGRTRGVPWLLKHGADPNYIDPEKGESALHIAAARPGSTKLVKLLLAHGADPRLKNRKGAAPCLLASRAKAWGPLKLMEEAVKKMSPKKPATKPAKKKR